MTHAETVSTSIDTLASEEITRQSSSNLALAFVLLPRRKRRAMAAIYAFCRRVDDIADEDNLPVDVRRQRLQEWRTDVHAACTGIPVRFSVNRELQPVIAEFRLPFHLFDELILGVEMDLEPQTYPSVDALEAYCYRVASVVGLLSIEVFGYRNPATRDYAIALGRALQWTNILRDIGNDAARGRVYLPKEMLESAQVTREEILSGTPPSNASVIAHQVGLRARHHFRDARELLPKIDRTAMRSAELMAAVYWRLLQTLERASYPVWDKEPLRLSKLQKTTLALKAYLKMKLGAGTSTYGR